MNELSRRIGKFDSPESLLKAYEALESEFTKRSQRLKETERENQKLKADLSDTARYEDYAKQAAQREDFISQNILTNEDVKNRVIKDYLTFLTTDKGATVLSGNTGKSVLTPPPRPVSLSEAKRLADIIINS